MRCVAVPAARVMTWWWRIREMVEQAVNRSGEMDVNDVLKALLKRDMQLWLAVDEEVYAICVTEIQLLPKKKICQIVYLTGRERWRWERMILIIEAWAREAGCEVLKPITRPGWERDLSSFGFRKTHVVLEKAL